MPRQVARSKLDVPVVAHLHRQVCPPRGALLLTDLENALLLVVVPGHVVGDLVGAASHAGTVGSAVSIDERAVRHQRVENEQRIWVRSAEPARLAVQRAGTPAA